VAQDEARCLGGEAKSHRIQIGARLTRYNVVKGAVFVARFDVTTRGAEPQSIASIVDTSRVRGEAMAREMQTREWRRNRC